MPEITFSDRTDAFPVEKWSDENYPITFTPKEKLEISQDEIEKLVEAPLTERVKWIRDFENGKMSEWQVDSALCVTGPSDSMRKQQSSLWEKTRFKSLLIFDASVMVTLLSFGSHYLLGVKKEQRTILSIIAIAAAIFAAYQWIQAGTAAQEIEKWKKSPPETAAKLRTETYAGKNLQENVLHPLEKEALIKKSFA